MKPRILSSARLSLPLASAIFAGIAIVPEQAQAQQYWNTNGTLNTISAANWGTLQAGPFTSAFTTNGNIIFGASSLVTGATVDVGNITVGNGFTVTFTAGGTLGTGGNVRTLDIGTGSTLDLAGQNLSTAAGTGFIKNGAGTLISSNGNAYGGGFTLNAGTVAVGGVNAMGGATGNTLTINGGTIRSNSTNARDLTGKYSGGITIGGNFTLGEATNNGLLTFSNNMALGGTSRTITTNSNAIFGGIISGSPAVGITKAGTGTLTLSGANSYSGGTALTAGTLTISNATSLGAGAVTVTGTTARIDAVGGITYANAITVGGALTFGLTTQNSTVTYSGQLTGASAITITGPGGNGLLAGQAFTNTNNTFTGNVIMPAGNIQGYDTFTFNSIGDGGNFTLQKAGNQNTIAYTGSSNIVFNTRVLNIAQTASVVYDGGGTNPVNMFANNGGGTVTFNTNMTVGAVTTGGGLVFGGTNTGNNTFGGTIPAGSGGLFGIAKTNAGKWILTGSNAYTGEAQIRNGTLSVNAIAVAATNQPLGKNAIIQIGHLADTGTLEFTGGTNSTTDKQVRMGNSNSNSGNNGGAIILNNGNGSLTFSATTFNPTVATVTATRTLTLGGSNSGLNTISGIIQDNVASTGRVALTKTGAGTWVLSGANTYTGGTNVNGGTLLINGAVNMPATGTLAVGAAGNFSLADGTVRNTTVPTLTLASGSTLSFDWSSLGTVDNLAPAAAVAPAAAATIGIVINPIGTPTGGGNLLTGITGSTLNNPNYFLANNTNFTATITKPASAGAGSVSIGSFATVSALTDAYWKGGQVTNALGAMAFSLGATSNWVSTIGGTTTGVVPGGSAVNVIFGATGSAQQSAVTTGANMNLGSITFNDSTAVTLGGLHTITLNSTSATAAATAAALGTITNTGTGISAISVTSFANATNTISANLALGANQTWNVASAKTLAVSGVVSGAGFTLTKESAGQLTLSGANTYTGITNINSGTLRIGNATALGTQGGVTDRTIIASGATLDLGGVALGANNEFITASGAGVGGNGAITSSSAIASPFIGVRFLTLAGDTTLGFTNRWDVGNNTTGGTLTGGGFTLNLVGSGIPAQASFNGLGETDLGDININLGSDANNIVYLQGSTTLGQAAKTVTISGGTTLQLFSNVTLSSYDKKFALNTGKITIDKTGGVALPGTISLTGTNIITANAAAVATTASGVISGAGDLTKAGAGTLTLSTANSYTGLTTVSAGTLRYGVNSAISTGAVTLGGGTLDIVGFTDSVGAFTLTTGILKMAANQTGTAQLESTGAVDLGTTNTLDLTGMGTTAGIYKLVSGTSLTGSFTAGTVTGLNSNYILRYGTVTANQLDAQRKADQSFSVTTPTGIPRALVSTNVALSGTLTNTSPTDSSALAVALSSTGALTVGGLASSTGSTVVVGTPSTVTGSIATGATAGTFGWAVTNTDANAITSPVNISGNINVVDQRSFSVGTPTIALGRFLTSATPAGTTVVSSTGLNAVTANATLGGFSTVSGLTLTTVDSTAFNGAAGSQTANYTVGGTATAGAISGNFSSAVTAELGSISNVTLAVTGSALDQRSFSVGTPTIDLGRFLAGATPVGSTAVNSTGLNADTANATLGGFSTVSGLTLTTGDSTAFNGAAASQTANYTVGGTATAGAISGNFSSAVTAEFGSISNVTVAVTGNALNQRTITNGATTNLGRFLNGASVSVTSNAFTTVGLNATTTSVQVAAGSGSPDVNGITLNGAASSFSGGVLNDSATRTFGGTITGSGVQSGSFTLGVTTLENGGIGLTGETAYSDVTLGYSANVVDQRSFSVGTPTIALGTIHAGAASTGVASDTAITSLGLNAVTANATLGSFTGTNTNGLTLTTLDSSVFNGGAASQTANYLIGGSVTAGVLSSASFSSAVTAELGSISNVVVNVTGAVFNGNAAWTGAGASWGTGASSNWVDSNSVNAAPGTFTGFGGLDSAAFTNSGIANLTVSLNGSTPSLNAISFNSTSSYTVAQGSSGSITLAGTAPTVTTTGTHEISAPVALAANPAITTNASSQLTLSGAIGETGGARAVTVDGSGLTIFSAVNTYTGGTLINGGQLSLIGSGALDDAGTVTMANTSSFNISAITGGSEKIAALVGTGSTTVGLGVNKILEFGNGTADFAGNISGTGTTGGITKSGTGVQTLSGNNTYSGNTNITSGTLLLGSDTALSANANVTLSGGILRTGGFDATAGTLTVGSGTTVIDFTNATSVLNFADSSAITWSGILQVWNWNGGIWASSSGGAEKLNFPNSTSLTSGPGGQLANVQFYSDGGTTPIGIGATFLGGTGELVPVPEPTALGAFGALLGFLGFRGRRSAAQQRKLAEAAQRRV